jgi:hypothetical protein
LNHSDIQKRTRTKSIEPDQTVSRPVTVEESPVSLDTPSASARYGMEPVRNDLVRRFAAIATEKQDNNQRQQWRRRKRKPANLSDDEYDSLITTIKDYARKNGAADELRSHITHACDLIDQSGCSYGTFYGACIEAYRRTEERRMKGRLEKPMAYWFTCLKTELGLQAPPNNPSAPN